MSEKSKILTIDISDLIGDERNANKGKEKGNAILEDSIRRDGIGRGILVDKNNKIIAGNTAAKKIKERGFEKAIVVETDGKTLVVTKRTDVDIDSRKGRRLAINDNAAALYGIEFDTDVVMSLDQDFNLDLSFDFIEDEKKSKTPKEDGFEFDIETIETSITTGDIYEIIDDAGISHRLMCGDASQKDDLLKLMNGDFADIVFTDPPYELNDIYSKNIVALSKKDCHIFIMSSDNKCIDIVNNNKDIFKRFFAVDFRQPRLVSNKQPMSRVDLIVEMNKGKSKFVNLKDAFSTLIQCAKIHSNKVASNFGHKQAKRVELPFAFISHFSKNSEIVMDVFGGSGSTMIAASQLGRRCYMLEKNNKYCQVILDRFSKHEKNIKITKIN